MYEFPHAKAKEKKKRKQSFVYGIIELCKKQIDLNKKMECPYEQYYNQYIPTEKGDFELFKEDFLIKQSG